MYIKMKFIGGVIFLVIQLSSVRAVDTNHTSEYSHIASPTLDDKVPDNQENIVTLPRKPRQTTNVRYPVNHAEKKSRYNDREKAAEIVYEIKARRYNRALETMEDLQDEIQGTMNYVIHEVYNNDEGNFNLILQFVDSNQNETTSFAIYQALNYEMNSNGHNDRLLRLRLMKSFNSKSFNPWATTVVELKSELHNFLRDIVVEQLKDAMKTKNSTAIFTISENIYNNYPELFNEVIKQSLYEAFDEIKIDYLVKFFMSHKYESQNMGVYSAVFDELKMRNNLNQSVVVTLAFGLKKALDDKSLDLTSRQEGYRLKRALPSSTRHIAFTSPVCIANANGEFLYGASDIFNHDPERRRVYTYIPKIRPTQGIWFIERHGDVYQIKNYRNKTHSEYLYGSVIPTAEDWRFVFTWIPGGTENNNRQYNWMFEPSGDYVYIRNEYRKEYLYANNKKGEERRYVNTHRNQKKVDGSLWTVEDCYWSGFSKK